MQRKTKSRTPSSSFANELGIHLKAKSKKRYTKRKSYSSMVWLDQVGLDEDRLEVFDFFKLGET